MSGIVAGKVDFTDWELDIDAQALDPAFKLTDQEWQEIDAAYRAAFAEAVTNTFNDPGAGPWAYVESNGDAVSVLVRLPLGEQAGLEPTILIDLRKACDLSGVQSSGRLELANALRKIAADLEG
jgi:hypothetical protein